MALDTSSSTFSARYLRDPTPRCWSTERRRILHIGLATLCLLIAHAPADATESSTEAPRSRLWVSEAPGAKTFAVQVQFLRGVKDEGRTTRGAAAAMAAWLIAGPLPNLTQDLKEAAAEAGLSVAVNTGWWSTTLTITGSADHLDHALWLAFQRLLPTTPLSAERAADVQQGLWHFNESLLRSVRSPAGAPDDALLAAMLGGVGGRSAFLSMAAAHNRSPDSFGRLARLALDTAQARLHVVASAEALDDARALLRYHHSVLAAPAAHAPPQPTPLSHVRLPSPAYIELDNQIDGHETALAGWRLHTPHGLDARGRLQRDAKMLVLQAWFEHAGGALKQALVREARMFHSLDIFIRERPDPILVVAGHSSHPTLSKAHERLVAQAEHLATTGPSAAVLRSAKRAAITGLSLRWSSPARRIQLLSELSATGRIKTADEAEGWLSMTVEAIEQLDRPAFVKFGAYSLAESRRSGVRVRPASAGRRSSLEITDSMLDMFVRMLVDMRCPLGGGRADVRGLLRDKYKMTTARYARLTRAVAREPHLMHRLGDEARTRCAEFKRLRAILPPNRIPALHDDVSCGPGLSPQDAASRKRLRRILRRYGVDRSWVRPLVGMAREDLTLGAELSAIDARCGPSDVQGLEVRP